MTNLKFGERKISVKIAIFRSKSVQILIFWYQTLCFHKLWLEPRRLIQKLSKSDQNWPSCPYIAVLRLLKRMTRSYRSTKQEIPKHQPKSWHQRNSWEVNLHNHHPPSLTNLLGEHAICWRVKNWKLVVYRKQIE